MKFKLILSSLLFVGLPSAADEYAGYFECSDKNAVPEMIDHLLSTTTRQYKLKEVRRRNADSDHIVYYNYLGASADAPDSVKLVVEINFFMRDANPDLNIAGTPVYRINSVVGEYPDVFPIYRIVAPEATAENTVRYGAQIDVPDTPYPVHYSIRKSSGSWKFRRF